MLRAFAEPGRRHERQRAEAVGAFDRSAGKKLGPERHRERIDGLLAIAVFGDHVEHVMDGIGIEPWTVLAFRPVGEAETRKVDGIDLAASDQALEDRLHLIGRSRRVDAVHEQQRRAGSLDVVAQASRPAADLAPRGIEGRGKHRLCACLGREAAHVVHIARLAEWRVSRSQPPTPTRGSKSSSALSREWTLRSASVN